MYSLCWSLEQLVLHVVLEARAFCGLKNQDPLFTKASVYKMLACSCSLNSLSQVKFLKARERVVVVAVVVFRNCTSYICGILLDNRRKVLVLCRDPIEAI